MPFKLNKANCHFVLKKPLEKLEIILKTETLKSLKFHINIHTVIQTV